MTSSLVSVKVGAFVELFGTNFTFKRLYSIVDPLVNLQVIFRAEQFSTVDANL